jgi:hypothetical protein
MANSDAAFGLRPVNADGRPYCGTINRYYVPSSDGTALFTGDPVVVAGTATATDGVPTITRATAGNNNQITGVVVGFEADDIIPTGYRAASTARYVLVADDPDQLFEIQEDAVGGALAITGVGANAELVAGTGSTVTGLSAFELDSSSTPGDASSQLRVERFVDRADNEVASANAKFLVRINLHSKRQASAGV